MPLINKQTKWRIHLFTAFLVITARTIRSVKYIQTEELEEKYIYYPSKGICTLEEGQEWVNSFPSSILPFFFFFYLLLLFYFKILYWFYHTSTWIHDGCTCVPHPEPPSDLPSHTIPLGHPNAPAPSILYPALILDWWCVSYMILYMFQCHSPKSSHPLPLPQSPKDCSIHLCLFCCLT